MKKYFPQTSWVFVVLSWAPPTFRTDRQPMKTEGNVAMDIDLMRVKMGQ